MKHPGFIIVALAICNAQFAVAQWNTPQVVGQSVKDHGSTLRASEVIIHPDIASAVPVGYFEEANDFTYGNSSATDSKNLRFFLIIGPSNSPQLYTVDLITGSLLSKVNLPDSNFYWWSGQSTILYDSKADRLFALLKKDIYVNADSCFLITIDPVNGNIDTLQNLGYGIFHLVHSGINEYENVMYCMKQNQYFSNSLTLLKIHLDDVSIEEVPIDAADYHFNYFEYGYHCRNGLLYGVEAYGVFGQSYQSGDFRIAIIETQSGIRTVLSDVKKNTYLDLGVFSMMPFSEKFYFSGSHITSATTGNTTIFSFDIMTNELSDKSWIGNYGYPQWTSYIPYSTSANFSVENFCLSGETRFNTSPKDAFNYSWNFDDPDSGIENFSAESDPAHVYSDTGWYHVTLVTGTCYHSDTVSQWIHIDEFPSIDLGADTSICTEMIGEPLVLDVSAPESASLQWPDYSSDSFFAVTVPGIYFVTVTSGCGSVSDSITVIAADCSCPMKVIPNLTGNLIELQIGCELKNYPQIRGSVFNMLGQQVIEFVPNDLHYQLPLHYLAAGHYILVVADGNMRLLSQKIVVLH